MNDKLDFTYYSLTDGSCRISEVCVCMNGGITVSFIHLTDPTICHSSNFNTYNLAHHSHSIAFLLLTALHIASGWS